MYDVDGYDDNIDDVDIGDVDGDSGLVAKVDWPCGSRFEVIFDEPSTLNISTKLNQIENRNCFLFCITWLDPGQTFDQFLQLNSTADHNALFSVVNCKNV